MFISDDAARIPGVTTPPGENPDLLSERGKRLRERIDELGLDTSKAARLAHMSRGTAYKVFKGDASPEKMLDMERALDDYEAHPADQADSPIAVQSTEEGLIEIELDDVYGIGRIVVRGPEGQALVEHVVEIVRRIRETGPDQTI